VKQTTLITLAVLVLVSTLAPAHAEDKKPQIVHDAEYYILDAQQARNGLLKTRTSTRSWLS